ncbi:MAG: hypothetical protein N4A38_00220 [Candidatus Gracilibacteria bacterium]|nr:hypothetical protein [Candidatus Gracilibacteria bacterium]
MTDVSRFNERRFGQKLSDEIGKGDLKPDVSSGIIGATMFKKSDASAVILDGEGLYDLDNISEYKKGMPIGEIADSIVEECLGELNTLFVEGEDIREFLLEKGYPNKIINRIIELAEEKIKKSLDENSSYDLLDIDNIAQIIELTKENSLGFISKAIANGCKNDLGLLYQHRIELKEMLLTLDFSEERALEGLESTEKRIKLSIK